MTKTQAIVTELKEMLLEMDNSILNHMTYQAIQVRLEKLIALIDQEQQ